MFTLKHKMGNLFVCQNLDTYEGSCGWNDWTVEQEQNVTTYQQEYIQKNNLQRTDVIASQIWTNLTHIIKYRSCTKKDARLADVEGSRIYLFNSDGLRQKLLKIQQLPDTIEGKKELIAHLQRLIWISDHRKS